MSTDGVKRAQDITSLTDVQFVLKRTQVYAGSPLPIDYNDRWIYDFQSKKMVKATFPFIPAVERVYLEILSNAADTIGDCNINNIKPGPITVNMNDHYISVSNIGAGIAIEKAVIKDKHGNAIGEQEFYLPQQIFGTFKTGSNFVGAEVGNEENRKLKQKKKQHAIGQNGIGSKLCNALSTHFEVFITDPVNKKTYKQLWQNNMDIVNPPEINHYSGKDPSVTITYLLDFKRFGLEKYDAFAYSLFARHAIDVAFNIRNEVIFNGTSFKISDIKPYSELYFDNIKNPIIYSQWPEDVVLKANGKPVESTSFPEIELLIMDTPDSGEAISFVNSLMTPEGGKHVEAAISTISDGIVKQLNDDIIKKVEKHSKIPLTQNMKTKIKINKSDVMQHISLIISVRLDNPDLDSQTKQKLNTFPLKIKIPDDLLKKVTTWKFQDRLKDAIDAKKLAILGSVKAIKGGTGKTTDAENAGKKGLKSNTILYITEGDSAAGYVLRMRQYLSNGCDFIGILPVRGKCLNVTNADILKIESNEEYQELKKALGIEDGVDYSIDSNFDKLRYGRVMILTDADVDGKHITGLILNYFYNRFRSLLHRSYIMYYRTPLMRVWEDLPTLAEGEKAKEGKNNTVLRFYTKDEYNKWASDNPDKANSKKWKVQYYKGLGTSDDWDTRDDLLNLRNSGFIFDADAEYKFKLAFDKRLSKIDKKKWINDYEEMLSLDQVKALNSNFFFDQNLWNSCTTSNDFSPIRYTEAMSLVPISWFLDKELLSHSIANTKRVIPRFDDGLKESVRKIIHTAHKHWTITKKGKYAPFKVEQFGGDVAYETHYDYAENNIRETIVGLAQFDYPGSNIVPLFYPSGNFGSSWEGGSDHAAFRYLFTFPTKAIAYIFRKEDEPILQYKKDEGTDVEPYKYYPIVPIHLINGVRGIGTGWSSFIPSHNPVEIVEWLRRRIRNDVLPVIKPYFKYFKGDIVFGVKQEDDVTSEDDDDDDDSEKSEKDKMIDDSEKIEKMWKVGEKGFVCVGKYHEDGKHIVVTQLPVGVHPCMYVKFLKKMKAEGKIKEFITSDNGEPKFVIKGWKNPINHKSLKLIKNYSLGNMVLLNKNNKPVRYDTVDQILEDFYVERMNGYTLRKQYELNAYLTDIKKLDERIRFLEMVRDKTLILVDRKRSDILEDMKKYGFEDSLYTRSTLDSLSHEKIQEVKTERDKLIESYKTREMKTELSDYDEELVEFLEAYNNNPFDKKIVTRSDDSKKKGRAKK